MDQETRQTEQKPFAQLGAWAQRLLTRAGRIRSGLSPWIQRALEASTAPADRVPGIGARRPTAFSEQHTRALLARVSRTVEESQVWRPDVGSVSPATFDRFAGDIVQRHQPIADKYHVQVAEYNPEEETGLVLAPIGGAGVDRESGVRQPEPSMPQIPLFPPPTTEPAAVSPRAPTRVPRRTVQRQPGTRIFSRVEEITPDAKPSAPGAEAEAALPGPGEVPETDLAQAEEAITTDEGVELAAPPVQRRAADRALPEEGLPPRPDAEELGRPVQPGPPEGPLLQRGVEEQEPAPPPEADRPGRPVVGPERADRPATPPARPVVQRRADEGIGVPAALPEEEAPQPAAEAEPPPVAPAGPEADVPAPALLREAEAALPEAEKPPVRPPEPPVQRLEESLLEQPAPAPPPGEEVPPAEAVQPEPPEAQVGPPEQPMVQRRGEPTLEEPAPALPAEVEEPVSPEPMASPAELAVRPEAEITPPARRREEPAPVPSPLAEAEELVPPEVEAQAVKPVEKPLAPAVQRLEEPVPEPPPRQVEAERVVQRLEKPAPAPPEGVQATEAEEPMPPELEAQPAEPGVAPEAPVVQRLEEPAPLLPDEVPPAAEDEPPVAEAEVPVQRLEDLAPALPSQVGELVSEAEIEPSEPLSPLEVSPVADARPPVADARPPVADVGPPVADVGPPVAGVGPPVADVGPPVAEAEPPVQRLEEPRPPEVEAGPVQPEAPPPGMETGRAGPLVRPETPPVQRLEEPTREELAPAFPPEAEAAAPPEGRRVDADRGVPAPQEPIPSPPVEVERAAPATVEGPTPFTVQRLVGEEDETSPPEPEGPAPPAIEVRRAGLDQELLARAASREHLPLTRPPRMISTSGPEMTALPQARIQPRPEAEAEAAPDRWVPPRPGGPSPELGLLPLWEPRREPAAAVSPGPDSAQALRVEAPLPPPSRPPLAELVQRLPLAVSPGAPIVQRTVGEAEAVVQRAISEGVGAEEEKAELDLDDLARQVYPMIKRMLAIERERLPWFR
jgi:hypothetical protein